MKTRLYDLLEDFKSPLPLFSKWEVKGSLLFICLFIASLSLIGCDVEEPFEVDNSAPVVIPNSFTAIDFPSADGDSWEYVTTDGQTSYTATISGTKNINGDTVRILETDSTVPTDYTGAGYGFPVRYYYFTKDLESYTEYAFDLWVKFPGEPGDTYPQRYQPKHITWSFPLYEGKEWTVSRFYVEPYFTYARKVVSAKENVTTPAGTFANVFHIQESVSAENQPTTRVIADYWLVKGKGIIKYSYVDPISTITVTYTYELRKFTDK